MTLLTNGEETTAPPAQCPKTNAKGQRCRKIDNHVARCRFVEAREARAPVLAPRQEHRRQRVTLIIVGGEPDAREAVAQFVHWALGALTKDLDSTFADPPRNMVEATTALEGCHIAIRNAGG